MTEFWQPIPGPEGMKKLGPTITNETGWIFGFERPGKLSPENPPVCCNPSHANYDKPLKWLPLDDDPLEGTRLGGHFIGYWYCPKDT